MYSETSISALVFFNHHTLSSWGLDVPGFRQISGSVWSHTHAADLTFLACDFTNHGLRRMNHFHSQLNLGTRLALNVPKDPLIV